MKRISLIVIMLFSFFTLGAVSFKSSVMSTDSDLRFSGGFYPVSGTFSYEASLPDYFDEISSSLTLNFDAGLKHRLLIQNPESGEHIKETSSLFNTENARFYQVHYIYFTLDYELGLINVDYLSDPMFALIFSLEGDYENAYERLGWLNGDGEEAVFTVVDGGKRESRFNSYSGLPEFKPDSLTGYRQLSHTGMRIGAKYNYTEETRMTKDGLWAELFVRYMPSWFPLHDDGGSSYLSVNAAGGAAFTILNVNQFSLSSSSNVLKMFTLVVETEFDARFITGKAIPQYALERSVWGSHTANSSFLVGNTTSLVFRGPQIFEDLYPTVSVVSDTAYAFGAVANGEGNISAFSGSLSLSLEADLFDTLYLYAECGLVYASVYEKDKGFRYSFGVRLGI